MKKLYFVLAIIGLIGSCTPEENGTDGENNTKETAVTSVASDITEITAVLSGYANVTPEMGNIKIGILYSTDEGLSLENSIELISRELDDNNQFKVQATELSSNTTYYYKAFVFYGGVYRYGNVRQFTTLKVSAQVATSSASDIGMFSAQIKGTLNVDSKVNLEKAVWFLYGTNNSLESLKSEGQKIASSLSIDNVFTCKLSSLSYGKTYYYVACAKVYDTEFYGEIGSFTTADMSAGVTTAEITDVGLFTATFNGSLFVENTESLSKDVWFLYSDKASNLESLKSSGIKRTTTLKDNGSYTFIQTDLNYATKYYYVACAKVHDKEYYGNVVEFSTLDIIASVETIDARAVRHYKATVSGELTVENTEDLSKNVWFLYGTSNNLESLKSNGTKQTASLNNDGSFSVDLNGLNYSTTYYFVACSKVYDKEFYGEIKSFTTNTPYVATIEAENVGLNYATIYGRFYSDKNDALSIEAWFLYGATNDLESLKSSGSKVTAEVGYQYSWYLLYYNLQNLNYGSTYYYVACVKIGDSVFYGEVMSFNTSDLSVDLTTLNASDIKEWSACLSADLVVNEMYNTDKTVWFLWGDSSDIEILKTSGKSLSAKRHWSINNRYYAYLTDLNYATTYYFVACTQVYDKVFYGEVKSFKTLDITVSTSAASEIGLSSARLNGKVSCGKHDGDDVSGWFYFGNSNDAETLKSNGTVVEAVVQSNGLIESYYSVSGLNDNTTYYYIACAKVNGEDFYGGVKSFTTQKNSDYGSAVDLGLSVKWRDCNIGARYPGEKGDYYAWGETETKTLYNSSTYKWHDPVTNKYTKYVTDSNYGTVDNKTVLDAEDDVAHVKLGGDWRMPTMEEWKELRENCTWTLATKNNVDGLLATSKKNGNSVFFPRAGCWAGDKVERESIGYYWCSSLYSTFAGWTAALYSDGGVDVGMWLGRTCGFSIRPVTK